MPKKKRDLQKQPTIKIGNISHLSGNVNVAGGNITTHHTTTGLSSPEIRQLFNQLYVAIDTNSNASPANKEELRAEVKEIQTTVIEAAEKGEKVDEGFMARRFRNIARMAPDVLDVVVAMLANPALGIGVAVKKIAEKVKEETNQG